MVECSVAGLNDMDYASSSFLTPLALQVPVEPSSLDRIMFELVEAQWGHRNELETLHASLNDFCKMATENLKKTTKDLLERDLDELCQQASNVNDIPSASFTGSLNGLHPHMDHPQLSFQSMPFS